MEINELKSAHADCVSAAASAAWRAWWIGVIVVGLCGCSYLLVRFCGPFMDLVTWAWRIDEASVYKIYIVFIAVQKLILLNGLLVCAFLSFLAKRLKAGCKA